MACSACSTLLRVAAAGSSASTSRSRRTRSRTTAASCSRASALPPSTHTHPLTWVQVDRVIACRENAPGELEYLVKWEQSPYADASWEVADDIADDEKLTAFEQREQRPTNPQHLKALPKGRRQRQEWKKQEASPAYAGNNRLRPYQLEGLNVSALPSPHAMPCPCACACCASALVRMRSRALCCACTRAVRVQRSAQRRVCAHACPAYARAASALRPTMTQTCFLTPRVRSHTQV